MRWAVTIDPFLSLRAHVETRKKLQREALALACASCSCITMRSCDCNSYRCRIVKERRTDRRCPREEALRPGFLISQIRLLSFGFAAFLLTRSRGTQSLKCHDSQSAKVRT